MTMFEHLEAGLSGLDELQGLIASSRRPPVAEPKEFDLVEARDGYAVLAGVPGQRAYSVFEIVHGGYVAALLDSVCGCAIHSKLPPERTFTAVELKTTFHRPLRRDNGIVRAEAQVLSLGGRVAFAEAKLVDGKGRLCASATVTALILERAKHR